MMSSNEKVILTCKVQPAQGGESSGSVGNDCQFSSQSQHHQRDSHKERYESRAAKSVPSHLYNVSCQLIQGVSFCDFRRGSWGGCKSLMDFWCVGREVCRFMRNLKFRLNGGDCSAVAMMNSVHASFALWRKRVSASKLIFRVSATGKEKLGGAGIEGFCLFCASVVGTAKSNENDIYKWRFHEKFLALLGVGS